MRNAKITFSMSMAHVDHNQGCIITFYQCVISRILLGMYKICLSPLFMCVFLSRTCLLSPSYQITFYTIFHDQAISCYSVPRGIGLTCLLRSPDKNHKALQEVIMPAES